MSGATPVGVPEFAVDVRKGMDLSFGPRRFCGLLDWCVV